MVLSGVDALSTACRSSLLLDLAQLHGEKSLCFNSEIITADSQNRWNCFSGSIYAVECFKENQDTAMGEGWYSRSA